MILLTEKKLTQKGVGYITKNNKKEQIDNKLVTDVSSSLDREASPPSDSQEVELFDSSSQEGGRSPESILVADAPTPNAPLYQDIVKTAMVQYYQNEGAQQKRKLKLRLNLTDSSNWDFIASLTQDRRNFLKHIPGDPNYAREWAEQYKSIKKIYGVKPWLGKFHLVANQGYTNNMLAISNEPECYAAVWYDSENKGYTCNISLYDFQLFDLALFKENVTDKQKRSNQVANTIWNNPLHNTIQRPKTFAQLRSK